jgi:hypothetical protein
MKFYEECSELEKRSLNGFMNTLKNFKRHLDYKTNEVGRVALERNIMQPITLKNEMWVRSTATVYRKLTMNSDEPYSFDVNKKLLQSLCLEGNPTSSEEYRITYLFELLNNHRKRAWQYNPIQLHHSSEGLITSERLINILHNEYIFHTDTTKETGSLYEDDYESFGDIALEMPYFMILAERYEVFNHLNFYIDAYKHGEIFNDEVVRRIEPFS